MEKILKSLNNITIPGPYPTDMKIFLKTLIELLGYSTFNDHEIKGLAYLCLSKLILGIGCYVGKTILKLLLIVSDSSYSKIEDCMRALLNGMNTKFDMKEVIPVLTMLMLDSLFSSKQFCFTDIIKI